MFLHSSVHNDNHNYMLQFPAPLMDRSRTSWKPNIEQAPNCPRCACSNTKFCYYNNYSLSQPRYFCKGCRRYWTKGGSLRNVPVGGGCRKSSHGKAAKQPQNERGPMTYTRSFSENSDSEHKENTSDIDLAVVFAKFLNQNLNSGQEFNNEANMSSSSSSSTLSNILKPQSVEAEHDESQKQCERDPITDSGILLGELPREEMVENIVGEGLSGMELQGLLGGDELGIQDVLWSEDATTWSCSATCWQPPMMELQQLENSMPPWNEEYGQFSMSISDGWSHWSSFDLSTLEAFSRP